MIDFITVLLLSNVIAFVVNEHFNLGFRLKTLFNYNPLEIVKPFDCRFCMHFWTSSIISLTFAWLFTPQIAIILLCVNTVFAQWLNDYFDKK